jgi:DNA polymerase I-like protein with 3'-5' exonuclease and polymerase domains
MGVVRVIVVLLRAFLCPRAVLGSTHSVVGMLQALIRVRELSKRRSFFNHVVGDSLYPQFRVKGTQTDRMTSCDPPIQNMPARASDQEREDGVQVRRVFTPPSGYQLLIGDFDQFEMRRACWAAWSEVQAGTFGRCVPAAPDSHQ